MMIKDRLNKNFMHIICGLFFLALTACGSTSEKSIFLIPQNFQGNVLIIFDQKNGRPAEYEKGLRTFTIPETGVLRTQFQPDYGVGDIDEFYFVEPDGRRTKLKYFVEGFDNIREQKKTDVICFNIGNGYR